MVKMFGPSISDPSRIVNRDVPECDVAAYKAAGYQLGSVPDEKPLQEIKGEAVKEPVKRKKK